jgi:hypothetical protein
MPNPQGGDSDSMKLIYTAFLAMGLMLTALSFHALATPEMTKKEKKPCTTCHVKTGTKDLNDVGKCYQEKKNLTDCAAKK